LNLSSEKLVSKFAFKFNLCRYSAEEKQRSVAVFNESSNPWWGSAR
jgi:hypothetical protein